MYLKIVAHFTSILYRNTDKYSIQRTVILIAVVSALIEIPVFLGAEYFLAKKTVFLICVSIIPSIGMVTFNVLFHRKLKVLRVECCFDNSRDNLRKSIFKAKMSLMITLTFVVSQIIGWISFYYLASFYGN